MAILKPVGGGFSAPAAGLTVNEVPMIGIATDLVASPFNYVSVPITAAQVATLRATPIEIVPAPAATKIVFPIMGSLTLDYNSVAYTETTDNLALLWKNSSTYTACSEDIEMTSFITLTADSQTSIIVKKDAIGSAANCAGKSIVIQNTGDGEFGNSGNSPLIVKLVYVMFNTDLD